MADEERLLALFAALEHADRHSLLAFAEFLHARAPARPVVEPAVPEPESIPRPAQESVVEAMRRLSRSYHMLDKRDVLHQASALMAQHLMQGRSAADVIDELELIFERGYRKLVEKDEKPR